MTGAKDVLIGGTGNDLLNGGRGRDLLIGVDVDSFAPGVDEIDEFRGGRGGDTFVLGDALEVYYDDARRNQLGLRDYALIKDFNQNQDVIRLHGSADQYSLQTIFGDTGIFFTGGAGRPELVGVVRNVDSLNLNSSAFEYAVI